MATWRERIAPIIRKVIAETAGAPEADRRRALREAYPLGERKYWPYKVWLDEIKRATGARPPLGSRTVGVQRVVTIESADTNQIRMFEEEA